MKIFYRNSVLMNQTLLSLALIDTIRLKKNLDEGDNGGVDSN